MSCQFKPGDLAILKSSDAPHLIGATIELIQYLGTESTDYGRFLIANPHGKRLWWVRVCNGDEVKFPDGKTTGFDEGPCNELRMMPLKGDFAPQHAKSQEMPA